MYSKIQNNKNIWLILKDNLTYYLINYYFMIMNIYYYDKVFLLNPVCDISYLFKVILKWEFPKCVLKLPLFNFPSVIYKKTLYFLRSPSASQFI